jgi:hypothetical protein
VKKHFTSTPEKPLQREMIFLFDFFAKKIKQKNHLSLPPLAARIFTAQLLGSVVFCF